MAKREQRSGSEEENFHLDLMNEGSITDSYKPDRRIKKRDNKENAISGKLPFYDLQQL